MDGKPTHKALEQRVKTLSDLLRQIGDHLPEGMVYRLIHDANGRRYFEYASSGFERILGLKPAELVKDATPVYDLIHPDDIERAIALEARAIEAFKPFNFEGRSILPKGEIRWFKWHSQPNRLDNGSIYWDGVCLDVTRQKKMESALKEAQVDLEKRIQERTADLQKHLLFEQLLTNLSARFIDLPPDEIDREIESGLRQILDLFGLDRCGIFQIMPENNTAYLTHIALRKGVSRVPLGVNYTSHFPWIMGRVLAGEIVSINSEDFPPEASKDRRNSKEIVRFRYALNIPLILQGKVRYMVGMTVDRSEGVPEDDIVPRLRLLGEIFVGALERILAAQSLIESEEKYRIVANFTYDWEYWTNLDGTLRYVSPSCERVAGYTPRQFMDNPSLHSEIIIPEDQDAWNKHYHDSRKEPRIREIQFRIQARDGTIRWIEHACQPVVGAQGEKLGFRASNRDITSRKEGEIKLQNAYSDIEVLKVQLEADRTYLREEIKLDHDYENIIGDSNKMKYVLFRAEQVAPTETTVLILGETGTGKELIARAIHSASLRKERPLIKVDCASLPTNLIESELFGHEKGAFTGAVEKRVGRFELANGATIFLDEIGELPLDLQPKLLRVLQDGEFERLGSSQTLRTDVRVISATNRDLEEDIRKKQFRMDLWYRLSVFTITVPPLRKRSVDIPLIVNYLIKNFERKLGKSIVSIPTHVLNKLQNYPWPGNVRELENVIERAVLNTPGGTLRLDESLDGLRPENVQAFDQPAKSLTQMEQEYILQALEKTNWKINGKAGAAALLDINPSTLRGRMRKHGLHRSPDKA